MPELPDVEVLRRYLNRTSLHKKLTGVEVEHERVLQNITSVELENKLKGRQFKRTKRHGKYIFACVDEKFWIMFHFGMTGFLKYFKKEQKQPSHTRVLFHFENGFHLAYDNQRMLGKVELVKDAGDFVRKNDLGEDARDISLDAFQNRFQGRRGSIKTSLTNQSLIAGIGNIYSDEILFQTKIHPKTPIKKLDEAQIKKIHKNMNKVLETAIEKKVDPDEFPHDWLIPYRGKEDTCPRCGGQIKKIKVNNRGTYFCSKCQPPPK
ncbi:MAG TPA: DNA-formamidopyrimidine glycosylase family protein [Acidobacteriota bacterium]|nr:DNA-formamidopyrimidine glycosylase family protein [Acidobacteriota bacterium]